MDAIVSDPITVLNAQLSFLDSRLALVHIPISAYQLFLHPILQLLVHNDQCDKGAGQLQESPPWKYWHPFVNISITSNECSIVCPREYADTLFQPLRELLSPLIRGTVTISHEDFSAIAIGGPGMDAGARVIDLTSPLAMAGIPIFFITSYYADYILVPQPARSRVISALEERGFIFEADAASGEAGHMINPASPLFHPDQQRSPMNSMFEFVQSGTPPAASISELQARTFKLLRQHGITPVVDRSISLVTCGGYKDFTDDLSAANFTEGKIQLGLTKCFTMTPPPKFLSVTLTDSESVSITLERRLTELFYNDGEDLLLGKDCPEQVAITFDLEGLPLESTGIVCGVASRLADGMRGRIGGSGGIEFFNMSYLSTARAGHVLMYHDELDDAMEALKGLETNGVIPNGTTA